MAFDHHAGDGLVPGADLAGHFLGDPGLVAVVFVGIAVGAVDHDRGREAGFFQHAGDFGDIIRTVVSPAFPAAQDDVAGIVAGCLYDGGDALLGDAQEMVAALGGADGVDGNPETAAGAVFKAYGHGQAAG